MVQLSIIVPVYNAEKYLKKCIDSILNQTYRDFELILVNDGSKDNSASIIDDYKNKHPEVVVIHKENGGPTTARREGIKCAKGEYVLFVDSDDWLEDSMCETMLNNAKLYGADAVICDMLREEKTRVVTMVNVLEEGVYDKAASKGKIYPVMLFDYSVDGPATNPSLCNKMIKREILEKILKAVDGNIAYGEDALCSYPALLDAETICVIRKPFYHYRYNNESVTNVYDEKLLDKFLLLHDELKKHFETRGFDATNQLYGYVAKYSLSCIRKELLQNKKVPLKKRIERVKQYVKDPRVRMAFEKSINKVTNKKTKKKMKLICKDRLYNLFLLFWGKEAILKIKGAKNEN